MDNPKIEEYLGVDAGAARIGIARGNSVAKLAEPLKTVAAAEALRILEDLVKSNAVSAIVVGLPRNLDGNDTPQTKAVRRWTNQLKSQINRPLYWQDEALTSQAGADDAQAAAIILQDFLDGPESDRVAI